MRIRCWPRVTQDLPAKLFQALKKKQVSFLLLSPLSCLVFSAYLHLVPCLSLFQTGVAVCCLDFLKRWRCKLSDELVCGGLLSWYPHAYWPLDFIFSYTLKCSIIACFSDIIAFLHQSWCKHCFSFPDNWKCFFCYSYLSSSEISTAFLHFFVL